MPRTNQSDAENQEKKTTGTGDSGEQQLQETFDRETEQGFRGFEVDPTPNENYTVAGVTKGLPTPETDAEAARTARQETGMGLSAVEFNAANQAKSNKEDK